jgi:hypothetical protein
MWKSEEITMDDASFKCLVIGQAGAGKSVFASTFPGPAFVFDFDQANLAYRYAQNFEGETYAPIADDWVRFTIDLPRIVNDDTYKTIILDSTTTLGRCAMARAMQINPARSPSQGAIGISDKSHYMIVKNLVESQLNILLSSKKNIVVISHLDMIKDEVRGLFVAVPVLPGALKVVLPTLFHEVYYALVEEKGGKRRHVLQTINAGMYGGKSAVSGVQHLLPDYVDNSYPVIQEYLRKGK